MENADAPIEKAETNQMADLFEKIQRKRLGMLCNMFSGVPVSPREFTADGDIEVISLRDTDANFNFDADKLSCASVKVFENKFLRDGDVLIKARSHDFTKITIARAYKKPSQDRRVVAGPGFIFLRPLDSMLVKSEYLAWIINNMTGELSKLVSGSAILQLNIKPLTDLEIPIPNIEAQEKIIATQNEVNVARKMATAYFANIEDLMVAKLKSATRAV